MFAFQPKKQGQIYVKWYIYQNIHFKIFYLYFLKVISYSPSPSHPSFGVQPACQILDVFEFPQLGLLIVSEWVFSSLNTSTGYFLLGNESNAVHRLLLSPSSSLVTTIIICQLKKKIHLDTFSSHFMFLTLVRGIKDRHQIRESNQFINWAENSRNLGSSKTRVWLRIPSTIFSFKSAG